MEAILDQCDLTVSVGNNGGKDDELLPAYEYDDIRDRDIPLTQQCWIPAKPGSTFCIHYCWNGTAKTALKKQAGLFCTLYIDELVVDRAFLPLKGINKSRRNREWEITGKYYRGPKGPTERPFKFMEAVIDDDADVLDTSNRGTIRVVLHWAKPDPNMVDPFPDLSKETADALALELEAPVSHENDHCGACVALGDPIKSSVVKENNMKVRRINEKGYNKEYTFIFHYAHPDWLESEGIIPPKVSSTYRTQTNA